MHLYAYVKTLHFDFMELNLPPFFMQCVHVSMEHNRTAYKSILKKKTTKKNAVLMVTLIFFCVAVYMYPSATSIP